MVISCDPALVTGCVIHVVAYLGLAPIAMSKLDLLPSYKTRYILLVDDIETPWFIA
jgi:hypothetical protein